MITSIHFQNFRALRDATLPLGPFTLIVGPNGSGKSTAMQAFRFVSSLGRDYRVQQYQDPQNYLTVGSDPSSEVEVHINWLEDGNDFVTSGVLKNDGYGHRRTLSISGNKPAGPLDLHGFRVFSFDANAIAKPVETSPDPQLGEDGSNLAAVLDGLQDSNPERLEEMNRELNRWLPE